jgi:hypothetical protein
MCFAKFGSLPGGPPRLFGSSWDTGWNQNWVLTAGDSDSVALRVATGSGDAEPPCEATNVVTTGTWYHITGVYDGSYLRVYIDGVEEANLEKTGNVRSVVNSETALFTDPKQTTTRSSDAEMYDVRVYNRALLVAEINTIYQLNGRDSIYYGLVARWKMDDLPPDTSLSGSEIIKDMVGGYHATPVNTPIMGNVNPLKRSYGKRYA